MKPILLDLPVPITTPRLLLRPPQIGDGQIVNAAVLESWDTLSQFMPWANKRPSTDETEEFVRQAAANWILKKDEEPYLPLWIFNRHTNEFIGASGYHNVNWEVPYLESGYWVRTAHSGQGYITETLNALTRYAFTHLHVKRIAITCEVTNVRSKKVAERLGYTLEGTLKRNRKNLVSGEISDTLLYARYDLAGLPDLTVDWPQRP